jgi:hypothetical protein
MRADLLARLRKTQPDATEREAELFELLWTVWPEISPNYVNVETWVPVRTRINDYLLDTYGLQFRDGKRRAQKTDSAAEAQR